MLRFDSASLFAKTACLLLAVMLGLACAARAQGGGADVTTGVATNVSSVTATLNGVVNAHGASSAVSFEYGPTVSYGSTVSVATVSSSSELPMSATLSGLSPGTTYHYRILGGANAGTDMTFTTAGAVHVPRNLLTTLPAPRTGTQTSTQLGYSVAIDGIYTVVGAPLDDTEATDSGVVKVFHSSTGTLMHIIPNPEPATGDQFGFSVAISGTKVLVGTPQDDTGVANTGRAYVFDLSSVTPTIPVRTLANPTPGSGDEFGYAAALDGNYAVLSARLDDVGAANAGSAYVFDLTGPSPEIPLLTVNNPGPAVDDQFGISVAVSGSRFVVGAWQDDTGAANAGSAYVYDLTSGTPATPTYILNNPSPVADDLFGRSVAISGSRVLVGARATDVGALNSGSAYVYDLSSGTPSSPILTLPNPSPVEEDQFGTAVALSGSIAVVGTYLDDTGATDAGNAYVYDLAGGTPATPIHILNNPAPANLDWFGYSVAVSGVRVLVAAPLDNAGAADAGSAYLYEINSGTPTVPVFSFNSPGSSTDDRFGRSTAISGTRTAVGMPREDTGASNAGSVFVYDSVSGTPTVPILTFANPSPATDDNFGESIAYQDGRLLVGVPNDDTGAANAGCAYYYDGSGSTPTLTLLNPAPNTNDNFGNSVAMEGTLLVVAASEDDTAGTDSGTVYVYDLASATPTVPVYTLQNPSPGSGDDSFGSTVAISGRRIVVAAVSDDQGATDAGSVYVYDLNSGTPTVPVAEIFNPTPAAGDFFGYHVAISGTRVVVGALADDTLASDAGSAYVYDLASGISMTTLANPSPVAGDNFGHSVAISGNWVLIGASNDGTAVIGSGSAYFYDLGGVEPTVPVQVFTNPSPQANDDFGLMMAMDGQRFVIGAPFDDTIAVDKGAAYLYAPLSTPEIAVEVIGGSTLEDGTTPVLMGYVPTGGSVTKVFRITNLGGAELTGLNVSKSGSHAVDFTLSSLGSFSLAPGASTTFTVTFSPGALTTRTAALQITSDDADENPFDVPLLGAGQAGTLDSAYDVQLVDGEVNDSIELPDGKIMIGGTFRRVNGVVQPVLARLNGDGTLDTSFVPVVSGTVNAFILQPDGKLLVGGSFTITGGGTSRSNLARLNSDGSLDTSLPAISFNSTVSCLVVQADGKMVVGGYFSTVAGVARESIARLNVDGSLDLTYDPNASASVDTMALQPDGKVVIGGQFSTVSGTTRNRIARINTDGSLDTGFNPNASSSVRELVIQSDNKILMGGYFSTVGGVTRSYLARLNTDGSLDTGFNLLINGSPVEAIAIQSDGKILAGGLFTTVAGGLARQRLARFNSDGTVDVSFRADCDAWVNDVMVMSDGRIVVGGEFSRVAGQFSPLLAILSPSGTVLSAGITDLRGGTVLAQSILADGKLVIGGSLSDMSGISRPPIARLLPSGAVDPSFVSPFSASGFTYNTIPQTDGRLIYHDSTIVRRLNADGSVDSTFTSLSVNSTIYSMAMQADGKILVGGYFGTYGGQTRNKLARINANGTLDTGFNPNIGDSLSYVYALAVQPDGKILVGGTFTTVGGVTRNRIARLNSDGSLDTGFDPGANSSVYAFQIQPDGKILVGGGFTTIAGGSRTYLARLNVDGTLDGFAPQPSSSVFALALQTDGKILVGGSFTANIGGGTRNRLARLNADGSLDNSFLADLDSTAFTVTLTREGQVLVGGFFSQVNGEARISHARLLNQPAVQSLTVNAARNQISWLRQGTSPEVDRVTFETSTDGLVWTSLGQGSRTSTGWQLTGVSLPASGFSLRAQGWQMTGGYYGGDSSLYETQVSVPNAVSVAPEITVEQPANTPLVDGVDVTDFGTVSLGTHADRTFYIRNTGGAVLTEIAVVLSGPHAADYSLVGYPEVLLPPGAGTTFTVRLSPSSPGPRLANIQVHSTDADEAPFDIALSGFGQLSNPVVPMANVVGGFARTFARQPDGKIWVSGNFDQIGGAVHTDLARLNADGTLDAGINFTDFSGSVEVLKLQADGKLLFGGSFSSSAGSNLRRLNADGTVDTAFTPVVGSFVYALAQQADGKLLVGGSFTGLGGQTRNRIGRLNLDGTLDSSFNPDANSTVETIAVQADGKILIGGSFTTVGGFTRNRLARLNADGSVDSGYDPNANGFVNAIYLRPDGGALVVGGFSTLAGTAQGRMAIVNSDGSLDNSFNPNANGTVEVVAVQADGKLLIGGSFTTIGGVTRNRVARLNADGSLDTSFDCTVNSTVSGMQIMADGKILIGGFFTQVQGVTRNRVAKLNVDGSLDSSIDHDCNGAVIFAISRQPDSKTLIGGWFTYVNDVGRAMLARLNADNSLDTSFNPAPNGEIYALAQQPDGMILAGGIFSTIAGTSRNYFARLHPNGSLDAGFNPNPNSYVRSILVEPSGTILIGGDFTTVGGTGRNRLARISAAGVLDSSFNPNVSGSVYALARQEDGKILLGGSFSTVGGNSRVCLARVNADGSLDTSFNANLTSVVYGVQVDADGTILVNGTFTTVGNANQARVARLTSSGTLISSYGVGADADVSSLTRTTDGRHFISGRFTSVTAAGVSATRGRMAQFDAAGRLNAGFNPQADFRVDSLNVTAEGRLVAGGLHAHLAGVSQPKLFSLDIGAARQALTVNPAGTVVTWARSGSSPEVDRVTLESSLDGSSWSSLGSATRSGGVWEVTGLSLPPTSYYLRARGYQMTGGYYGGDASVYEAMEQVMASGASAPEIVLESPPGTDLVSGSTTHSLGGATVGGSVTRTYTIRNVGFAPLTGLATTFSGTHPNDFSVTTTPVSPLAAGGDTTFTVRFAPMDSGLRTATMKVWSNDEDENPFVIELTGTGLATTPLATTLPATLLQSTTVMLNGSVSDRGASTSISFDYGLTNAYGSNITAVPATLSGGSASAVSAALTGLSPQTTYYFRVRAVNSAGTTFGSGLSFTTPAAGHGEVDLSFPPTITGTTVRAAAQQGDEKILIGGTFTQVGGVARNNIARFNFDGTLDAGFNPDASNTVNDILVREDGKIIVAGSFSSMGGTGRGSMARLNVDGSLDTSFVDPGFNNTVLALLPEPDGRIIAVGHFTSAGGQPRNYIARINDDGTLDASYNPNADNVVRALVRLPDGRVIVGGQFTQMGGTARSRMARLNTDGSLDPTYNPGANAEITSMILLPDGKLFVAGVFTTLAGSSVNRLGRLNADGTLDNTYINSGLSSTVNCLSLQADGRLIVGGFFSQAGSTSRNRVARFWPDGSLDSSFAPSLNNIVDCVTIMKDGRILLGGTQTTVSGHFISFLTRLSNGAATESLQTNSTGTRVEWLRGGGAPEAEKVTFDFTINAGTTWVPVGTGTRIAGGWEATGTNLPSAGRLRARARVSSGYHMGSMGLIESTLDFSGLTVPRIGVFDEIGTARQDGSGVVQYPDTRLGSISSAQTFSIQNMGTADLTGLAVSLASAGDFTVTQPAVTTLAPGATTSFTVSFSPGTLGVCSTTVLIASNDAVENPFHIAVSGTGLSGYPEAQTLAASSIAKRSVVLNASVNANESDTTVVFDYGLTDAYGSTITTTSPSLVTGAAVTPVSASLADLSPGTTYHFRVRATNSVGTTSGPDLTFTTVLVVPGEVDESFNPGSSGLVSTLLVQPDGAIVVGGGLGVIGGVSRTRMARLDPDGTVQPGFNPNIGGVEGVALMESGQFAIGSSNANWLHRLTSAGAVDSGFTNQPGFTVRTVLPQADGKWLVGGLFTDFGSFGNSYLVRLDDVGDHDFDFDAAVDTDGVRSVAVQPDGKILVTGGFFNIGGDAQSYLARLNVDGSLDSTFTPVLNNPAEIVVVQPDGKILITGGFTTVNGDAHSRIARLNADGSSDTDFNASVTGTSLLTLALQADGKILLGGNFSLVNGTTRSRLARLLPGGALDTTFDAPADGTVNGIALQSDGRILVGGNFTNIGGQPRNRIARLENGIGTQRLTAPTTSSLLWSRGGSVPEVSRVYFETSLDGGDNWLPLGPGTRVGPSGHWYITGLALDESALFRVRGETSGGIYGNSHGWVESTLDYTPGPEIAVMVDGVYEIDSGATHDFGSVTMGAASSQTFSIRNFGAEILTGLTASLEGPDAAFFSLVSEPASTVTGELDSTTVTVRFKPTSSGLKTATLRILSNDADESPYDIVLTGEGFTGTMTDNYADRLNLGSLPVVTVHSSNRNATLESGEGDFNGQQGATVWAEWTAPTTGWVTLHTVGSRLDTVVSLYSGAGPSSTLSGLSLMGFNDESDRNSDADFFGRDYGVSRLVFWAQSGTTYAISVGGWAGDEDQNEGLFELHIKPEPQPLSRITSLSMTPNPVDVTSSAQTVTTQITVETEDPSINFMNISASWFPASSSLNYQSGRYVNFTDNDRVSGNIQSGVYEQVIEFPRYASPGIWPVSFMVFGGGTSDYSSIRWSVVGDDAFEDHYLIPEAVSEAEEVINAGLVDTVGPTLVSVTGFPAVVDVSGGDVTFDVDITFTDAVAGLEQAHVWAYNSAFGENSFMGGGMYSIGPGSIISGDEHSGVYRQTVTVFHVAGSGVYYPEITLQDAVGNQMLYRDYGHELNYGSQRLSPVGSEITIQVSGVESEIAVFAPGGAMLASGAAMPVTLSSTAPAQTKVSYDFSGNLLSDEFDVAQKIGVGTLRQSSGVLQFYTGTTPGDARGVLKHRQFKPRYDQSWSIEAVAKTPLTQTLPSGSSAYIDNGVTVSFTTPEGDTFHFSSVLSLEPQRRYIGLYTMTDIEGNEYELSSDAETDTSDESGIVRIRFDAATKRLTAENSTQTLLSVDLSTAGWGMTNGDTFDVGLGFDVEGAAIPPTAPLTLDNFKASLTSPASSTFTITNLGAGTLGKLNVSKSGVNAADFIVENTTNAYLELGESTTFHVSVVPSAAGPLSATLLISSNDVDENPFIINIASMGTAQAPTALTLDARSVSRTAATLRGLVNPQGAATTASFEYGTTTSYGSTVNVPSGSLGSGVADTTVTANLSGLIPGTTYHYRVKAVNTHGVVFANDRTFTTPLVNTGGVDSSFFATVNGEVIAMANQPDGKIVIGGDFSTVNGVSRTGLARVSTNGTLDSSFNPTIGSGVQTIALQTDGKILVGGSFTTAGGQTRNRVVRFNADGTLDTTFNPNVNGTVYVILPQPDGRIMIGGDFSLVGGQTRVNIARLHADGSVGPGFNTKPNGTSGFYLDGAVRCMVLRPDGRVIVGGDFSNVGGKTVLIDADGSLDPSFTAYVDQVSGGAQVNALALQPDGKVLIGGRFTTVNGSARAWLARVGANGVVDASFDTDISNSTSLTQILSISLQADGDMVITGLFDAVDGVTRKGLARLNPDGTLDSAFAGPPDATGLAGAMLQANGGVLVGGGITSSSGLARVTNAAATQTLQVMNSGWVRWLRGATAPEASEVRFEMRANSGSAWSLLGLGSRITGGWEITGLSLPASGQVRATARVSGGYASASSGLVQTVTVYNGLPVADIAIFNGNSTAAANERVDNVGVFDFGAQLLGSSSTRTFTIRNSGSANLTNIAVSLSGVGEFSATAPGAVMREPGTVTTFTVSFTPTVAGVQSRTVLVASDDPDENPFEVVVSGHGQVPPAITQSPVSVMTGLGQALNLTGAATGTAVQFQWLCNGSPVTGATATTLSIPTAALGHAGEWRLRASNGVGTAVSQVAHVGVVDLSTRGVSIAAGGTLMLQIPAAAPQAAFRWLRGGVAVPRGINPETQLILSGIASDQAGGYSLQVTMPDPQHPGTPMVMTSGVVNVTVTGGAGGATGASAPAVLSKPVVRDFDPGPWITGADVRAAVTAANSPTRYAIQGLPAGVRLDVRTGLISGRPTTVLQMPRRYELVITASNAAGTSAPLHTSVVVQPLPGYTAGSFHGLISRDEVVNAAHGGRFQLTVSPLGALTGRLTLGAATHSFSGKINAPEVGSDVTATVMINRARPQMPLSLTFTIQRLSGELSGQIGSEGGASADVHAWHQTADAAPFAGAWPVLLSPGAEAVGDARFPQALSKLRLTITRLGGASWTGRLADGSSITGSSGLTLRASVPVWSFNASLRSSLWGWLQLDSVGKTCSGSFDWQRLSPKGGFPQHSLEAGVE